MWKKPFYIIAPFVWAFWALLLSGGLLARVVDASFFSTFETELKAGSSLMLVALGWLATMCCERRGRTAMALIAVGITLGCLGDASPLLGDLWPDPQRTLGNMVLFGLGHVAYIRAFCLLNDTPPTETTNRRWYVTLALWLAIGGVAWLFSAQLGSRHPIMKLPALGYTLLLSSTTGVAFGFATNNRTFLPIAIGALLFLTSDVLLAIWIFHDTVYRPLDLVWLTYGVGQMLIVTGAIRVQSQASS